MPIYGVFQWGWQSFDLIFLYWLENIIIGAFMIMRILLRRYAHPVELALPLFLVPFFTVHYGMFCFGHGTFILALFGKGLTGDLAGMEIQEIIFPLIESRHLFWPAMALFAYQLIDWIRDISERGFGSDSVKDLTTAPYRRIIILHITILASGFTLATLDEPLVGLLLLILFKTSMDIYHWDKDEKAATTDRPAEINAKMKQKIDAFLDDPKITVNGKEVRYKSFDELKASKHYKFMLSMIRMIGGAKQFEQAEEYVEQQARQRELK